jgi:ABC-type transport system involved in cytochrome bd biosynthesis fused ATPase/permease subunit
LLAALSVLPLVDARQAALILLLLLRLLVHQVTDADFSWDLSQEKPNLAGVNFEAKPGSLTMVVGLVGSGKTSILSALIGQMDKVKGSVKIGGSMAYVAQTAWIINDTVQVGWVCQHVQAGQQQLVDRCVTPKQ